MQIQLGTSKECMFYPINNTPDKKNTRDYTLVWFSCCRKDVSLSRFYSK